MENQSKISKRTAIKLPKIQLRKIWWRIVKWQEFWDTYEKFNYLKAELEDKALMSIAELGLTNANDESIINILK